MSASQLNGLLARMEEIAEAVARFESEAIQARVLDALLAAYGAGAASSAASVPADESAVDMTETDDPPTEDSVQRQLVANKTQTKRSSSRNAKNKQSFTIDKNLDLVNGAAQSFKDFSESKSPKSVVEKVLVSVYWLTRKRDGGNANVDQVYTCFKHMAWAVPADLVNTVQQAGTKGWLDSKKRDDLTVVVGGENYVEHSMPVKKS